MNLITQYIWTAHFGITVRIRVGFIIQNWIPSYMCHLPKNRSRIVHPTGPNTAMLEIYNS